MKPMMILGIGLIVLGAGGMALVAAAAAPGREPQVEGTPAPFVPVPVTILFGSNNEGVLVSCGCAGSPSGGFAKRQTIIDEMRRTRPSVLLVDAGDLFPEHPNAVKAKYLATALARAKYDALAVGVNEIETGLPLVRSMARDKKLPYICANLRDGAGNLIFPPHVIREVGGLRIGLFAVIAEEALGNLSSDGRKGLKVEPPIEAARREVRDLAGCDVVIALSHQPFGATQTLAREAPGIRVIVSGHDETILRKPLEVGNTMIVAAGPVGRMIGWFTVVHVADGDPAVVAELVGLTAQVPDTPWVTDLYNQYIKEAKGDLPPDWELKTALAAYEAAENCGRCHEAQYRQWRATKHAHAFATLQKVGRQGDPECIVCHTVGYGRGGFSSDEKTPDLKDVTCQTCHPVTSVHGEKGAPKEEQLDPRTHVTARLCIGCHGLTESPNFDYAAYRPMIVHKPVAVAGNWPKATSTGKERGAK